MIWSLLFVPLIALISLIITFIPAVPSISYDLSMLISFIRKGMYFTNASVFATCVSTFVAIESLSFTWSLIEFIYHKIPFINIR